MTQLKSIQILSMWDKINELSRQNLSQAQIAEALGCCRDTVRRYQHMSEAEFKELLVKTTRRHTCKLDAYYNFIADQLKDVPSLSAPQILDHLKEHFPNLPYVSDRTVYNMVQKVRIQGEIPKMTMNIRQMTQVPECEYGSQAQVDYGETWWIERTSKATCDGLKSNLPKQCLKSCRIPACFLAGFDLLKDESTAALAVFCAAIQCDCAVLRPN